MVESRSCVREIARLKRTRSIIVIRSDSRTVCASCLDRVRTPVYVMDSDTVSKLQMSTQPV
jgi:hypothetical protein